MNDNFEFKKIMSIETNKDRDIKLVESYQVEKYNGIEKKIVIPEIIEGIEVRKICPNCFEENGNIEKVILPKTLSNIDYRAFYNCRNLKQINLEDVKYIDIYAFSDTNIEKVLMKNIKEIGMYAFSNCTELQEVVIEDSLKKIDSSAFEECKKLKRVILPESLEEIKDNAFTGCKNIVELVLPSKVKISKAAFDEKTIELLKSDSKDNKTKEKIYNLETLLKETKKMKNYEIELYIKNLLNEHKLSSFDPSEISDMKDISFNRENGELNWKCYRCGYCTCNLWDILENNGKMINNFDISGCGYCK